MAALSLIALLAVDAAPLHAQDKEPGESQTRSFEFGAFVGTNFYAKDVQLQNDTGYGVRFGWVFKPPFELEFQYAKSQGSKLKEGDSILIQNEVPFLDNPNREFTATSYTLRFLINPRNERRRLRPFALFGLGGLEFSAKPKLDAADEGSLTAALFSIGGGIRFRLTGRMSLRAEFENQYAFDEIYNDQLASIGLTWRFGGAPPDDSDGDGVLDIRDRCPDTPKGALIDKHDGCPWDLDGDGVMEGIDRCPNTPRGWPVDDKGCPLDSDGDGVPDGIDKCPNTPKGAIVGSDGCPIDTDVDGIFDGLDKCPGTPKGAIVDPADSPTAGCPHDSDNDGVFDGIDQCPLTPPGAIVDEKGCPKDNDGDGVLDGIDECPDTPRGQKVDKQGCPRVRLDQAESQILMNVKFYEGNLYPGSDSWLALLLDAVQYWSDLTVEIGVYTDSGPAQAKRNEAQRDANLVKAWLVAHGISAGRIVAKGYGAVDFVADNKTDEGKEKNRRVEAKRLSGDLRKHPKWEPEPPAPPPSEAPPQPEAAPPSEGPAPSEALAPQEAPAPAEAQPSAPPEAEPEPPPELAPDNAPAPDEPPAPEPEPTPPQN